MRNKHKEPKPLPERWAKWSIQQHVDEAQRLAEQAKELGPHSPDSAHALALAQVHATLAVRGQVSYSGGAPNGTFAF
jgi:hypothetical protein